MAKSKGNRIRIKMKSTESPFMYHTQKNKMNTTNRLELRKFDPVLRKVVVFREEK